MPDNHTGYVISVVDEDPLRARKDARELLTALGEVDPTARLDLPEPGSLTQNMVDHDVVAHLHRSIIGFRCPELPAGGSRKRGEAVDWPSTGAAFQGWRLCPSGVSTHP